MHFRSCMADGRQSELTVILPCLYREPRLRPSCHYDVTTISTLHSRELIPFSNSGDLSGRHTVVEPMLSVFWKAFRVCSGRPTSRTLHVET